MGVGDTGTGGDLSLHAGKTTANNAAGGNIAITAGEASSAIVGTGGEVQISGGSGGFEGGAVSVTSGVGTADDSGSMTIATANSGSSGESGNMTVSTGSTTSGVSGGIAVSTGDSSDTSGGSAFSQATLPVGPRAISASRPATRLMARGVRSP